MALEQTMYSHGRYPVALDLATDGNYSAEVDGKSRPIPFQLNCADGGLVSVKLVDDASAFVEMWFNAGDNPSQVIAVADASDMSVGLVAVYPFKPAVTTIKTEE